MPDAAETCRLQRQAGRGDVDTHAADDDRYQFLLAESQPEIIDALHWGMDRLCVRKIPHMLEHSGREEERNVGHETALYASEAGNLSRKATVAKIGT